MREKIVLGKRLLVTVMRQGNAAFEEVIQRLCEEDFPDAKFKVLFAVCSCIFEMEGRITIDEVLRVFDDNRLEFRKNRCGDEDREQLIVDVRQLVISLIEVKFNTPSSVAQLCDLVVEQIQLK